MNDDVKAAVERFHEWEFDGLDARDHATLLAHIDGEPARTAAAREEQRAADVARSRKAKYALTGGKTSLAGAWNAGIESAIEGVESMPLTATPLADEITALRAEREAWKAKALRDPSQLSGVLWSECYAQAAEANQRYMAERPCLLAAVATQDEAVQYWTEQARALGHKVATLRAQVEAEATARARAEADLRDMVAERDDERDQRIVAEVDRDRARGAREVLGKLQAERDALRAQVAAALNTMTFGDG